MKTTTWTLFTLVGLAALCHVGFSSPVVKRQVLENPESLDPVNQNLDSNEESDRGKRKIEPVVELVYGAKNAVLGLVFNLHYPKHFPVPIKKFFPKLPFIHTVHKRAVGVTPSDKVETTTPDYVNFNPGERVSLEVPDQLFGSGFTLVTNVSQIVGSLIQNSAERTARVFEAIKPFLQTVFGVKSLTITRDGPPGNKI